MKRARCFTEDGRYIVAVNIAQSGKEAAQGRYVFYVIQTAESGAAVVALVGAGTAVAIYLIWKTWPAPRDRRPRRV